MLKKVLLGAAALVSLSIAAPAQADVSAVASACSVQHEGWGNGGSANFFRYVKVVNECGHSKTVCVDVPNWPDPGPYTIKAYERKKLTYGNVSHRQGRGLYPC
ncbi:hypothetical protein [Nonomuraea endophytica]|uniref:Secreted protein n=1 Tax=Nonomuraea endophytica TaxID=714136 RepID=A0A7W8A9M6_9ACTN|nr:hypothetical protein [Nonomuraea endophytica]MBB5082132.1 hypothetical protein [Nonomuraea endophytica]